jgi:hypothetical protein
MNTGQNPPLVVIVAMIIIAAAIALTLGTKIIVGFMNYLFNSNKQSDKRKRELADWAKAKGLSFRPDDDSGIENRYCFFGCLQQADKRYSYNIMEGLVNNRKVCAFDHHYEGSESNTRVKRFSSKNSFGVITYYKPSIKSLKANSFSVVIVETDIHLQPLLIRTEKFIDKVAEPAGLNDIDFESIEFNSQFYVKASDRRWAYDVVDQATMDLLLNSSRFNVELKENQAIAYRNELFEVGHFEEALQLLTGIVNNLPNTLFGKEKGEKLWS